MHINLEDFQNLDLRKIAELIIEGQDQQAVSPKVSEVLQHVITGSASMLALSNSLQLIFNGDPDAKIVSLNIVYDSSTNTYNALLILG